MRPLFLAFALGVVALSGCSSSDPLPLPGAVRERFAPTYRTRVVQADKRQTYDAAKLALKEIGFRFVNGGPAQGKLSGLNNVSLSSDGRGSRQLSIDVKLTPVPDGTEVAVLFSDVIEDDFGNRPGMGTTTPVRESALYEAYFRDVEQALAHASK